MILYEYGFEPYQIQKITTTRILSTSVVIGNNL